MDSLESFRSTTPGRAEPDGIDRMSRAIGWAGVGLGAIELLAPRRAGQLAGLPAGMTTTALERVVGLGNLVTGLGILGRPRRAVPMWLRVGNDVLGLALLALAGRRGGWRSSAALAIAGGALAVDAYAARAVTRAQESSAPQPIYSVTIARSPAEVYGFFRKLENLPRFMDYLESVTELGGTSHWIARAPGGTVAWDAEIIEDVEGERIAWRTLAGSPFSHHGEVTFAVAPGGAGTEVRVTMELAVPGVAPSAVLARMITKPQIKGDLRRLKQVLETGEVLLSDASAHRGRHPARPSAAATRVARARREQMPPVATRPSLATAIRPDATTGAPVKGALR
jgi:uncharacterized membrane protein